MTKGRLLLIGLFPLAVVVALGVIAILPSGPGVTKSNFDRIENGMTTGEVEAIFGREGSIPVMHEHMWVRWSANDGSGSVAWIGFVDNCVERKEWLDSDATILDRIRRVLHLQ